MAKTKIEAYGISTKYEGFINQVSAVTGWDLDRVKLLEHRLRKLGVRSALREGQSTSVRIAYYRFEWLTRYCEGWSWRKVKVPVRREWYILQVEKQRVKELLFETAGWTPMASRWTKPKAKRKPVRSDTPIFPTWIFLEFNPMTYAQYNNRKGVYGPYRGLNKQVIVLSDRDMETLRNAEKDLRDDPRTHLEWMDFLHVGMEVRVEGLLNGVEGVIIAIKGTQVSVNIGGNIPIEVDGCLISPRDI